MACPLKACSLLGFRISAALCCINHKIISQHLHHPQGNPAPLSSPPPFLPALQSEATTPLTFPSLSGIIQYVDLRVRLPFARMRVSGHPPPRLVLIAATLAGAKCYLGGVQVLIFQCGSRVHRRGCFWAFSDGSVPAQGTWSFRSVCMCH